MAFLDKTGLERLWEHIISRLGNKVDIVEGKGLSTNDYTDAEKQKLAGIAAGADVSPTIDATLSQQGQVADAAAVGEAIAQMALKSDLPTEANIIMGFSGSKTASKSASEILPLLVAPLPVYFLLLPANASSTSAPMEFFTFCGINYDEANIENIEYVPFSHTEIDENGNTVTTIVKVYEDKSITVETSTCAPDFVVTITPVSATAGEESMEVSSSHTYAEIMEQITAGRQVVARIEGIGDFALSTYNNNGIDFKTYSNYHDRIEEYRIYIMSSGTALLIISKYYYHTVATSTTLGSVMPVEKTSAMTTEVGIDATGRLYTTTPTIEHISDEEIYAICNMSIVAGSEVSL